MFFFQVYQLYLAFSIANGIGLGTAYVPATTMIDKYFVKYKNIAIGLASCGAGVGSFVFPPIIYALERTYGWRGTLLILAGVCLNALVLFAVYRPPQMKNSGSQVLDVEAKPINALNALTSNEETALKKSNVCKVLITLMKRNFICLQFHTLSLTFSFFLIYTHLGAYVLSIGFSESDVVKIYAVVGVSATISRSLSGCIAQLPGVNIFAFTSAATVICAVATFLFPLARHLYLLYLYGLAFGALTAPHNALCMPMTSLCVPPSLLPTAFGLLCLSCVPGVAAGPPLAGKQTRAIIHKCKLTRKLVSRI